MRPRGLVIDGEHCGPPTSAFTPSVGKYRTRRSTSGDVPSQVVLSGVRVCQHGAMLGRREGPNLGHTVFVQVQLSQPVVRTVSGIAARSFALKLSVADHVGSTVSNSPRRQRWIHRSM